MCVIITYSNDVHMKKNIVRLKLNFKTFQTNQFETLRKLF